MSGNSGAVVNLRICVVNPSTLTMSGTMSAMTDDSISTSLLRAIGRAKGVESCNYIYTNGIGITLTGNTSAVLAAQAVRRRVQAFFRRRKLFAKVAIV